VLQPKCSEKYSGAFIICSCYNADILQHFAVSMMQHTLRHLLRRHLDYSGGDFVGFRLTAATRCRDWEGWNLAWRRRPRFGQCLLSPRSL